jgi:hypothetical protein
MSEFEQYDDFEADNSDAVAMLTVDGHEEKSGCEPQSSNQEDKTGIRPEAEYDPSQAILKTYVEELERRQHPAVRMLEAEVENDAELLGDVIAGPDANEEKGI